MAEWRNLPGVVHRGLVLLSASTGLVYVCVHVFVSENGHGLWIETHVGTVQHPVLFSTISQTVEWVRSEGSLSVNL